MKSAVFRIRKEYFDAIVSGDKTIEYRKASPFWMKRLSNIRFKEAVAVFICGKRVHRRLIRGVELIDTPKWFSNQGQQDVDTEMCFAIHLGSVYRGKTQ